MRGVEAWVVADPKGLEPSITYLGHPQTREQMLRFFPGLTAGDLPDREGWALERVTLTHNGTHLDAPWHFASTMDGGKRAITIDEVPLEWCFRPGVKLDFRHFADSYVATAADVEASSGISATSCVRSRSCSSTPRPALATAGQTTSTPAAAWAARRHQDGGACRSPATQWLLLGSYNHAPAVVVPLSL
jgi:transposase InsO family protein